MVDPQPCVARSLHLSFGDCSIARAAVDARRAAAMEVLRGIARENPDVRVLDPITVFCGASNCSPNEGRTLLYGDSNHMSPAGIDRLFGAYRSDFAWVLGGEPQDEAHQKR